jgi:hypothetical protein
LNYEEMEMNLMFSKNELRKILVCATCTLAFLLTASPKICFGDWYYYEYQDWYYDGPDSGRLPYEEYSTDSWAEGYSGGYAEAAASAYLWVEQASSGTYYDSCSSHNAGAYSQETYNWDGYPTQQSPAEYYSYHVTTYSSMSADGYAVGDRRWTYGQMKPYTNITVFNWPGNPYDPGYDLTGYGYVDEVFGSNTEWYYDFPFIVEDYGDTFVWADYVEYEGEVEYGTGVCSIDINPVVSAYVYCQATFDGDTADCQAQCSVYSNMYIDYFYFSGV